mmetsp:Transcript_23957/g.52200  ORF Transcript_23957/g.52200 Transcript_23957/m.52200 type:complete len:151 (-) Transcript_23957:1782-2234(-)
MIGSSSRIKAVDVENGSKGYIDEVPQIAQQLSLKEEDLAPRKGTIVGHMFNVGNTVIGAGILGLPYSMAQVGWVSGMILLLIGAVLTQWAIHLLNKVCVHIGGDQISFGYVFKRLNKWMPLVADILVMLMCLVMPIVYLSVGADFKHEPL